MATYSVHFFCNECSGVHPLGITVNINDGPAKAGSINDTYQGKELPPELATLTNNKTTCPITRKITSQKDNKQVFLVPISD